MKNVQLKKLLKRIQTSKVTNKKNLSKKKNVTSQSLERRESWRSGEVKKEARGILKCSYSLIAEAVTQTPSRPARGYKSATSPERSRGLSPSKMQCSVLQQAALPVLPEPINTERHLAGYMPVGNTATFRQHDNGEAQTEAQAGTSQAERHAVCVLIRKPWRRQTTLQLRRHINLPTPITINAQPSKQTKTTIRHDTAT